MGDRVVATNFAIEPRVRRGMVFGILCLLVACGGTRPTAKSGAESLYQAAIEDARRAEPSETTTSLTPLVPYNDALVWRLRGDSTRQVLVVTWGDDSAPNAATGDSVTVTEDIWVTAVPKIRRFCRDLDRTGDRLHRRLAQRLGLPSDANYDQFVEFWVRPKDLVRPCPDPDVTDRECGLNPPKPSTHVQISDAHRNWFRTLKETSYEPDGYPFTGLGYAYDWHPATDEVGPSEFVLRSGRDAVFRATYSTAAYCSLK